MTLAAWIKVITMLITLVYNGLESYRAYEQRERGRLQLLLELRLKRDQEKAKANAIDALPVPPDDPAVIGRL